MQHVEKVGCVEKVFARRDRFEPLRESVVHGHYHRKGGNQAQGLLPRRRHLAASDGNTGDVSIERPARHAQGINRMNTSSGSGIQQLQRVPFEFPVGREFTAEPVKSFRIRQHVVPQEKHRVLERYVGREILHGESANNEFSLLSIDAADRGLRRDDTFEPRPIRSGWHKTSRARPIAGACVIVRTVTASPASSLDDLACRAFIPKKRVRTGGMFRVLVRSYEEGALGGYDIAVDRLRRPSAYREPEDRTALAGGLND
jgi:hypothetical protein